MSSFRASLVIGLCGAAALVAPASAQNILEMLFGIRPQQQQQVHVDRAGEYEAERRAAVEERRRAAAEREAERRREHHAAVVASGGVYGKMQALAPEQGVQFGSLRHAAGDETLRAGDVVVTPKGFMVYRGGGRDRIAAFQPVGASRSGLAALERASVKPQVANYSNRSPLAVSANGGTLRAAAVSDRAPDLN